MLTAEGKGLCIPVCAWPKPVQVGSARIFWTSCLSSATGNALAHKLLRCRSKGWIYNAAELYAIYSSGCRLLEPWYGRQSHSSIVNANLNSVKTRQGQVDPPHSTYTPLIDLAWLINQLTQGSVEGWYSTTLSSPARGGHKYSSHLSPILPNAHHRNFTDRPLNQMNQLPLSQRWQSLLGSGLQPVCSHKCLFQVFKLKIDYSLF
jgi:hypothetical protein